MGCSTHPYSSNISKVAAFWIISRNAKFGDSVLRPAAPYHVRCFKKRLSHVVPLFVMRLSALFVTVQPARSNCFHLPCSVWREHSTCFLRHSTLPKVNACRSAPRRRGGGFSDGNIASVATKVKLPVFRKGRRASPLRRLLEERQPCVVGS